MFKTRIELIAAFAPTEAPTKKVIPFLSEDPLLIQSDLKANDELLNELSENDWELMGIVPNGHLIYGFFQKYEKEALSDE